MRYQDKMLALIICLLTLFVFVPDLVIGQPPPLDFEPEQAPIDGGLGILAAVGGAYAIKKLREHRK